MEKTIKVGGIQLRAEIKYLGRYRGLDFEVRTWLWDESKVDAGQAFYVSISKRRLSEAGVTVSEVLKLDCWHLGGVCAQSMFGSCHLFGLSLPGQRTWAEALDITEAVELAKVAIDEIVTRWSGLGVGHEDTDSF